MKQANKTHIFRIAVLVFVLVLLITSFIQPKEVYALNNLIQVLIHSSNDAPTAGATEYNYVDSYGIAWNAAETNQIAGKNGTIRNMYVRMTVAPGAGQSYTFTLRKNGVDTALSVVVTGAATTSNYNNTSTVSIALGDDISIKCVATGAVAASIPYITMQYYSPDSTNTSLVLGSSAMAVLSNAANRYLVVQGNATPNAAAGNRYQRIPTNGYIRHFYVDLSTNPGPAASGDAYRFTLEVNGVATTLTLTISETATSGSNIANSVYVSAGDYVDILVEPLNGPANIPSCYYGFRFVADNNYETIVMSGSTDLLNAAATEYNYVSGYGAIWDPVEANVRGMALRVVFRDFYVYLSGSPDNGAGIQSYTFTFRVGGSDTSLSVYIEEADTSGVDTTHSYECTDGEFITVKCVPSGVPTVRTARSYSFVMYIDPNETSEIAYNETLLYESFITGGDAGGSNVYGANWAGQLFTPLSAHSVVYVKIPLQRTGNPGTLILSVRKTTFDGYPKGEDLCYATYDGDLLDAASYNWIEFVMDVEVPLEANVKYVLILRAIEGTAANYVQWYWDTNNGYPYGNAILSTNGGGTWETFSVVGNDYLFEIWGRTTLVIINAKVFTGYKETNDWLFVCQYLNKTAPYYITDDVSDYFTLRLYDESGNILAQLPCQQWGQRPGSIYLAASYTISLVSGSLYTLRLLSNYNTSLYSDYTLTSADWSGQDLDRLDAYCLDIAHTIQDNAVVGSEESDILDYISNRGEVLNSVGGVYFNKGIPGLSSIRPNLFATTTLDPSISGKTGITYFPSYQESFGPYVSGVFNDMGDVIGVNGRTAGMALLMLFYLGIMSAFGTGHNTVAGVLAAPFLVLGLVTGLVEVALMALIASILAILMLRQLWAGR